MKCGGCSAAVKRLLLQQPGVQGAAVNLLTETAVVQVAAPADHGHDSAEQLAAAAAAVLSGKGFPSGLRSLEEGVEGDAAALSERKADELKKRWVGGLGGLQAWSRRDVHLRAAGQGSCG